MLNFSLILVHNIENRLERVADGGGNVIATYCYDPFGRRLWKEVGGVRTYFVYSDEGLIGEYDASGNELKAYGYKPGGLWGTGPLFMETGGAYYFYHNDHLGTPQKLTAADGQVVWSARYASFGKAVLDVAAVENPLRFPGQYVDAETGLHYNWQRYYDPEVGRYLTEDPIGFAGGINLYAYVLNDPVNFLDPDGLRWQFSQSTGNWSHVNDNTGETTHIGTGYSGTGEGRNNPDMQNVPFVGPIPQGTYDIGPGRFSPNTGPNTMNLDPRPGTNTFGRDLFRIHRNNDANDASEGCPIAGPDIRRQINNSRDRVLEVVP